MMKLSLRDDSLLRLFNKSSLFYLSGFIKQPIFLGNKNNYRKNVEIQ